MATVMPDQAFVQILDPAVGTGTFLVEVIDIIFKTMIEKWKKEGNGEEEINDLWKYIRTRGITSPSSWL